MGILNTIQHSIDKVGIKEVARRSGLSPSTVSRINSGKISPSFEVIEKISKAVGFQLELQQDNKKVDTPRLHFAKDILGRLRNELKTFGVKHVTIFGSTARGEDRADSDIDIYIEFVYTKPSAAKLLKAEGRILEAFGENKVDIVSDLNSPRGQRLKLQINKDGKRVF
jgi:predicted nucleotidyltransferase